MKVNRVMLTLSPIIVALSHASVAGAQSLDVTLRSSTVDVSQGTTVVAFYANIIDPPAAGKLYLNGDSATTSTSILTVNDTPFFNNAPLSLMPGQSSGLFEVFDVHLPTNIPLGMYSGNVFSILGGPDVNAVNDLADVHFSVDVTASAPAHAAPEMEPASAVGSLTFLAGVLVLLFSASKPKKR